jgi:hypothetical protein
MRCQVRNLVSHTNAINLYDESHTFSCRGQGGSDIAPMPSPVNHDLLFRRASKPHGVIVSAVEWHQIQASQSRAPYTTESYTHTQRAPSLPEDQARDSETPWRESSIFDGSIVPAGWVEARDAPLLLFQRHAPGWSLGSQTQITFAPYFPTVIGAPSAIVGSGSARARAVW